MEMSEATKRVIEYLHKENEELRAKCNRLEKVIEELVDRATPKPKKVICITDHYFPETYDYDYSSGQCPNCKTYISFDETYQPAYCDKCGQALDWSEE